MIQHRDKYCRCPSCKAKRIQEKRQQWHRSRLRREAAYKKKCLELDKRVNKKIQKFENTVMKVVRKSFFAVDRNIAIPAKRSIIGFGDGIIKSMAPRPKRKKLFTRRKRR